MFDRLWSTAASAPEGLLVLNFLGIRVATSSFLREAVVRFRQRVREELPHVYPVLTNLVPEIEEELLLLLNQVGEAFWVFNFGKDGEIEGYRLTGRLDPKLRETLKLIGEGHGSDATTLWKSTNSTDSVGVTAWNNRLASLSRQGLVFESRLGKQKSYRPLHERVN
jgi:hypothetical protein